MSKVLSAGSKLGYGALVSGEYPSTFTDIPCLLTVPDIGGAPETIDTTTLDNTAYQTSMPGLQKLEALEFPFDLENPSAGANISIIAGLSKTTIYGWKITYASGITVKIKSKPFYKLNSVSANELEKFTLYLIPEEEPTIDVPSSSV